MHITSSRLFLFLILFFSHQQSIFAETKVIGYLPSYKGLVNNIDKINLSKITHLNIAFLNPTKNNDLVNEEYVACMTTQLGKPLALTELQTTVKKAHQANVKILASLGGAAIPKCGGNWDTLLQKDNRNQLVSNFVKFVDDFNLDGLDIDLEGKLLTSIDKAGNYVPFIKELSIALKARDKLLTAATGSYIGGMIPEASLPYFDFVNIMSYDAIGPSWGHAGGEHSTVTAAQEQIALWKKKGLVKNKLVLGLPFYGYGFGKYAANYAYKDILSEFGEVKAMTDTVGKVCAACDYITFNGINTIKTKTNLAIEQGAGVMVWELTHDAVGKSSLLNTIDAVIQSHRQMNNVTSTE